MTSIAPDDKPYKMLSNVSGFPLEKYSKMVVPSWLKAGLIKEVNSTIGKQIFSKNNTLFFPFMLTAYIQAQISDITWVKGCDNTSENPITNEKYNKFING